MSMQAMVWAMDDAPVNSASELAVLMALANHAHKDGRNAFPSQSSIARAARCSVRSARRQLANLEERGLIRRGNPALVAHIRKDYRPIVWDLNMDLCREPEEVDEVQQAIEAGTEPVKTVAVREEAPTKAVATVDKKPKRNGYAEDFERFWQAYPLHKEKAKAAEKFEKILVDPDIDVSVETLVTKAWEYAQECQIKGTPKKYMKYPQGWLGGKRWEDEYQTTPETAAPQTKTNQIRNRAFDMMAGFNEADMEEIRGY